MRAAAMCAAVLTLAACNRPAQEQKNEPTAAPAAPAPSGPVPPAPAPAATPASAPAPAPLVPEAEKGEKGARNVLLAWARDLELGQYDAAYALWLDGARSGMSREEHAAYWSRFKTVTVAVPGGTMEGAAGSSYYTAPATVVGKQRANGKPYRLEGTVVLRRVNDVPGATPEQLRWHIEQVDLKPVT